MEEKTREKIEMINKLAEPYHQFINQALPHGTFRTNQAWARLQESVNWASAAVLEEAAKPPKKKK